MDVLRLLKEIIYYNYDEISNWFIIKKFFDHVRI